MGREKKATGNSVPFIQYFGQFGEGMSMPHFSFQHPLLQRLRRLSFGSILRILVAIAMIWMGEGRALAQQPNSGQMPFVNWITTLSDSGYTVTNGSETDFPGCTVFQSVFGSCFGNNTATPYVLTQPPVTTPNNLPAYATLASCGFTGSNPVNQQPTDDLWQIAPDQAIVTIITLPPQAAYFGFQSYLLERSASLYTDAPSTTQTEPAACQGASGDGGYSQAPDGNLILFNDFYNSVNNADIAQIAAFKNVPWNSYKLQSGKYTPTSYKTVAIITTPNKSLVTNMLSLFSGDQTMVFTEKMPATATPGQSGAQYLLYPCTGAITTPCDGFGSIIRFTLPQVYTEAKAWSQGGNVLVYRVELPSIGTDPPDLYDAHADVFQNIYQQGCNTNETGSSGAPASCVAPTLASASFQDDLSQIAQVLQTWAQANTPGDTYSINQATGSTAMATNGGLAFCIVTGKDCGGPTQDTDFYRTFDAGTLKDLAPIFVVGVLHSDSPADFAPNGSTVQTAPVNNADYTGISIADESTAFNNTGVADAANPNSASEYYVPQGQRIMLGSASSVLHYLTVNPDGSGPTLFSQLPAAVQEDLDNIYIHVFQRNDNAGTVTCSMETCSNALINDVTTILDATVPAAQNPALTPPGPAYIPIADAVRLTERGYLLAPTADASIGAENFTGAAVQYLQGPFIICDTAAIGCPASN
jgi:hypothetical protein